MLCFLCSEEGRKLRYCINALLKSQHAKQVIRVNYAQSYARTDKLQKQQAKMLYILPHEGRSEKVIAIVQQMLPLAQQLPS